MSSIYVARLTLATAVNPPPLVLKRPRATNGAYWANFPCSRECFQIRTLLPVRILRWMVGPHKSNYRRDRLHQVLNHGRESLAGWMTIQS
jgi:hypothetical protein